MYQSPFSTNEIKYFMNLMQNDNTEGKGATYAKLEILYAQNVTKKQLNEIKGNFSAIESLSSSSSSSVGV